ncbi:5-methyltetrahydropteroyltriglutamate--homocysteine S-methyltransferase [Sanguibacter hominis ATCC BAA-789]|uniref:5-methyltetrahydropteroyltriglutamate--homocysteine methyltransferase n=1 Tax=Sanguibacter hominis ATCC BAA-789 TaxID=1312740 RepID=A0A9X5FDF6_9MICO|nr:5-methyltetrahydropteroyltriglutamate--homocysteine S-methyltransferase [Sanguibacter hominis]NKX92722.1 5-methyltetrahydropteroyltriglutamate--homocysteine S-methyltransferase [Sanguibacter hominis ATCC BAA-789]
MSNQQHSPALAQGTNLAFPAATVLGYPRIGPNRELKRAVEAFWAGRVSAAQLEQQAAELRSRTRDHLVSLGLTEPAAVPSSFSFYDQVLDVVATVGAVPPRFAHLRAADGSLDRAAYFALARGDDEVAPLEMTKWFDSNYHYLVPEIGPETELRLVSDRIVAEYVEAREAGVVTRPVVVGPVTFLLLSKPSNDAPAGFRPLDRLPDLLPVYAELLGRLADAGAPWVQLDEPALVTDALDVPAERVRAAVTDAYRALASDLAVGAQRPAILLAAPYGDLGDNLPVVAASDVEAVALDLVKGHTPAPDVVEGLARKTLVAGVVDGHNVWRADLDARLAQVEALAALGGRVTVGTSTSLFHVPHTTAAETQLGAGLRSWLAFADEKVAEVVTLARGLVEGRDAVAGEIAAASAALADRATAAGVRVEAVRARTAGLTPSDLERGDAADRRTAQAARLGLPPLPTTTIGSFPQTTDIRVARAAHARGELSDAQYDAAMEAEIARVIALQEEIGLDVLVHGEPERNDMVQYFAELLDGFAVTRNGWVQSYGTRCTRPSILWGDVSRPAPMTVRWTRFAQSLTPRPVKGMLTGPVTIMAWSFVRDDVPLAETANQIGFALRDELADLEAAGVAIIQVDEPALRELLPLRRADQPAYLDWSVSSFRLATSGVRPGTQVHTHLCYSEFGEVIGAIDALDADVTSIEAARSRMEILDELRASGFGRGVGPGVYDIHSPRVPSVEELGELIGLAAADVDPGLLWINPDCGLKTRGYAEVTPALTNLVAATRAARAAQVTV